MPELSEILDGLRVLGSEQHAVARGLQNAASAVDAGCVPDPLPLRQASDWAERLDVLRSQVNGEPGQTLAELEAHVREQLGLADRRRVVLEALAGARSAVEVTGLTELTALAREALTALDSGQLDEGRYAPLAAIHELLATDAVISHARLNACIPLIVQANLPVSLVIQDADAITLADAPDAGTPSARIEGTAKPAPEPRPAAVSSAARPSSAAGLAPDRGVANAPKPLGEVPERLPRALEVAPTDPNAADESATAVTPRPPKPVGSTRPAPSAGREPRRGDDSGAAGPSHAELVGELLHAGEPLLAEWLLGNDGGGLALAVRAVRMSWQLGEERDHLHEELEGALQQLLTDELHAAPDAVLAAAIVFMSAPLSPRGLSTTLARQAGRELEAVAPVLGSALAAVATGAENGQLAAARARRDGPTAQSTQESIARLAGEARDLHARLHRERCTYVPANRVLHSLVEGQGRLALVLDTVATGNIAELERLLADLDDRELRRLISETYRAIDRKNRPLESHARQWVLDRCARVIALGRQRLGLEREQSSGSAHEPVVSAVRDEIAELDVGVTTELSELGANPGLMGGAAAVCAQAWTLLCSEVSSKAPDPRPFRTERQLRRRFACLGIALDADAAPVGPDGLARTQLDQAEITRAARADLAVACEEALSRFDLIAADLLTDALDAASAERFTGLLTAGIAEERRLLVDRRRRLEIRLIRLIRSAAVEPRTEAELATLFDLCDVEAGLALAAYAVRLAVIESRLTRAAEQRSAELAERLVASRAAPEDTARVQELIAEEQFDVADELVGSLERGERLPAPRERTNWLEEFLSALESMQASDRLLTAFERRERVGEIDLATVGQAVRGEVLQAVTQLKTLKTPGTLQRSALSTRLKLIFEQIGFHLDDASVRVARRLPKATVIELTATPGATEFLPPEFGSAVGLDDETGSASRLAVIVARGTVNDREVIELVRKHSGARRGTLVLLPESPASLGRREQIGRLARAQLATFILVDEYALVNQALARTRHPGASPLDITLATSLPFCSLNPYVHTGSVPPEMFVGRTEELQELQSRTGSCFIFGGRQLGKSALLRTLRRREHHPNAGRICLLLDLMAFGVGERKPGDQLWGVIAAELDEQGVGASGATDRDSVVARIRDWIRADPAREVRLLLDECDLFLEREALPVGQGGQNFANVVALRSLMDDTDRRFKVVLAGLHSVNRFRRIANFPLAQFGTPAPIGPLTWEDARELVERPLRTAGFRFEPPDLVDRVLVETRRHPSLVQFACDALIQRFFERRVRPATPPFTIHASDLDDLFDRSKDLRDRIRERFEWTLNLDKRYRVLALMLALTSLDDVEARTAGMTAADLHEQAVAWWPAGFTDLDADAFEVLLEEMVNLGVLGVSDGRFRLPATNLLRMLGDRDEVINRLEKEVDDDEPPQVVNPDELRRDLSGREAVERSPLSFRDERMLLRDDGPLVRLVVGTKATLIDRVEAALAGPALKSEWPEVHVKLHDDTGLAKLAQRVANTPPGEDMRIVHVTRIPPGLAAADVAQLVNKFRVSAKRTPGQRHVLVAVLDGTEPDQWADLMRCLGSETEEPRIVCLRRWSRAQVGVLFNDLNIPAPGPEQLERIMTLTGGWPAAVEALAARAQTDRTGLDALLLSGAVNVAGLVEPMLTALQLPLAAEVMDVIDQWGSALAAVSIADLLSGVDEVSQIDTVLETLTLQQILDEVPGGYVRAGPH